MWKDAGADINYNLEELLFVALFHDLGKVGDKEKDNYVPNPSEWHRKKLGKLYTMNPDLTFMTIPDRSIWMLMQFNIDFSENEYLGIKLHDGMYVVENKAYLDARPEQALKTNLPLIIHHADMMATRIEHEGFTKVKKDSETISSPSNKYSKFQTRNFHKDITKGSQENVTKIFDQLFK